MTKRYQSNAHAALHESMQDLHEIGLVDKKTMRKFDSSCLTAVGDMEPDEIVAVRNESGVSQAVFARYLNVSVGIVSKWERGEKHPRGTALKLLTLVKKKGLEAIAI
ncbi:MAG: DNA-binding transcriptional regulator [Actinomycetota bacterium]|nr:DNA-binding transcriptional regulator [Actinomycetota bacterium]